MNPDCRVCEGIEPLTPESVANRPGLPALHYRVGRHGSFLESMIARLSAQFEAPVAPGDDSGRIDAPSRPTGAYRLQTREPGDPSIALLDAWATVGDVLSFYQERIANEGYLRTAREERSLHELAGLVGYKLRPALSSSVHLAFDVQEPPALDPNVPPPKPHNVLIPKGTQVKSIPASGELPQTFETSEELNARPEWNNLKPLLTRPTLIDVSGQDGKLGTAYELTKLRFNRIDHNLSSGDYLLLVEHDDSGLFENTLVRQISKISLDATRNQTVVEMVRSPLALSNIRGLFMNSSGRFVRATQTIVAEHSDLSNHHAEWIGVANEAAEILDSEELYNAERILLAKIAALILKDKDDEATTGYKAATALLARLEDRSPLGDPSLLEIIRDTPGSMRGPGKAIFEKTKATMEFVSVYDSLLPKLYVDLKPQTKPDAAAIKLLLGDATTQNLPAGVLQRAESTIFDNVKARVAEFHKDLIEAADEQDQPLYNAMVDSLVGDFAGGSGSLGKVRLILERDDGFLEQIDNASKMLDSAPWQGQVGERTRSNVTDALGHADNWSDSSQWWKGNEDKQIKAVADGVAAEWFAERKRSVDAARSRIKEIADGIRAIAVIANKPDITAVLGKLDEIANNTLAMDIATSVYAIAAGNVDDRRTVLRIRNNKELREELAGEKRQIEADWKGASLPMVNVIVVAMEEVMRRLRLSGKVDPTKILSLENSVLEMKKIGGDKWWEPAGRLTALHGQVMTFYNEIPEDAKKLVRRRVEAMLVAIKAKSEQKVSRAAVEIGEFDELDDLTRQLRNSRVREGESMKLPGVLGGNGDLLRRLTERFGDPSKQRTIESWGKLRRRGELGKVFAFKVKAGLFGSNSLNAAEAGNAALPKPPTLKYEDEETTGRDVIYLDQSYADIAKGGWCLLGGRAPTEAGDISTVERISTFRILDAIAEQRRAHGLSGKTVRVRLDDVWRGDWTADNFKSSELIRETLAFVASVELPLAEEVLERPYPTPNADVALPAETDTYQPVDALDLSDFFEGLETGRTVIISGEQVIRSADSEEGQATGVNVTRVCRVISADSITSSTRVLTTLKITPPLDVRFKRETVSIYANVVEATHGESVFEVLGNGEGQGAFQRFALSQAKLSHLPAMTPSGMQPEMKLRVNNVEWERADRIGDLQSTDRRVEDDDAEGRLDQPLRKYLISSDDEERAFITTGDGVTTGARLPTGIANVRATYRIGGGREGNLKGGTITQMMSPPLNVTKVRNLFPSTGGVDRESLDQARKNVSVAVQALDRLVSVTDYESFARGFAGIAKAQAARLRTADGDKVVVTVAGLDDIPINPDSLLYRNLRKSLEQFADRGQQVELLHRELVLLLLSARIKVHRSYDFTELEPRILRRLLEAFDFEKGTLGGSVLRSDVIEVIQNTPGVKYVDVDVFDSMRQFYGSSALVEKARAISGVPQSNTNDGCSPPWYPQPLSAVVLHSARLAADDDDYYLSSCVSNDTLELPDPRPAQLAYFTDLPGTILLEEIR